jgi:hypothetical protein
MYTDDDLNRAVKDGVLDQDSVKRFQNYIAQSRNTVLADEERFRLVSSFNDIFVLVASVMLIFGVVNVVARPWGAFSCAVLAWGFAEVFTKSRRMASPSIIYALVFSIAPAYGLFYSLDGIQSFTGSSGEFYALTCAAALAAACAALFWKRFQVPIAVTLFFGAFIGLTYALLVAITGGPRALHVPFFLIAGLATFAIAMRYDMRDLNRVTVNGDIAFWLHLLAASLTVHTVFQILELMGDKGSLMSSVTAIGAFSAFIVVALVIDRRAALVSAAVYVIAALVANFRSLEISKDSSAWSILLVGASLLLLAWGWGALRKRLLVLLPKSLAMRVPAST